MYLKGSKFRYKQRRTTKTNPWRIIVLLVLIGAALYFNQVVVPVTPPLFINTPTPTRSAESFVSEAENQLAEGKMSSAIELYAQAVRSSPRDASLYVAMARLYIYMGNYAEAVVNAQDALLLNNNNSTAHALLGWAQGFQGAYLDAIASLNRALELDPNNVVAYACLAEVLLAQNQAGQGDLNTLDEAVNASRKAQELDPNALETHRARGLVLEATANYEDAMREFEAAVAKNPNISDLHLALGRNYRALELYDKAVQEFNRANALNPTDPVPLLYSSRTYATVGEFAKAIQFAEQAVKADPVDPFLYGNLGTMYYRNRQYTESVNALRTAIQGGLSEDGKVVEGIPISGTGRVPEYYSLYGLALARKAECNEGLQVARLIQQALPDDETAVYNAGEVVNICREVAKNPPTATLPLPLASETPQPEITPTANP